MFAASVLPARGRRERGGGSGARPETRGLRAQSWGQCWGQGWAGDRAMPGCAALPCRCPHSRTPSKAVGPTAGSSRRSPMPVPRLAPGQTGLAEAGMCPGSIPRWGLPRSVPGRCRSAGLSPCPCAAQRGWGGSTAGFAQHRRFAGTASLHAHSPPAGSRGHTGHTHHGAAVRHSCPSSSDSTEH